jgi:hypothetical protein
MHESFWRRFKLALQIFLLFVGAAGWSYVLYNEHRAHEPVEIVKKHFLFYPEYSHGVWREQPCASVDGKKCREVRYTVPVNGCGPVTFAWHVSSGEDEDATLSYNGTYPKFNEDKYPLYAVLSQDSRLIDSTALGKELPETCQFK